MATPRLKEYRAKRDFAVTSEPRGEDTDRGAESRFVVQRHRARRLHYDFRLEVDGVLASWAVPKGPTLDPAARRLAVHVEDHPIEYADFEGVIPRGEYGGGDVIVWDRGTWTPIGTDEPAAAIAKGELHFELHGEKLAGRFLLVRRGRDNSDKEQWLMLHKRDDYARPSWDAEDYPWSVKSGRTNEETAANPDAMWDSHAPAAEAEIRLDTGDRPTPAEWRPATEDELAALDGLGKGGMWHFQDRSLKLTNLDKVLFPARRGTKAIKKRELIRYFATIAPAMLPYLSDRPVNLHRYPDGVDKPGFWHKEAPPSAPDWLTRWRYEDASEGHSEWYFVIDSPPALAWMANYGAVELHPWASPGNAPHQPSWAFIDIDPGTETTFDQVLDLARLYRTALDHLGVVGVPKLSGQTGVQIWIPVARGYSFDETRAWVEKVSRAVGATLPDLVSWEWQKDDRRGLARLDYTQNAINRTLVAPFSPRPQPGAPVSVPITWEELDDADLKPDGWTIRSVLQRLKRDGDPLLPVVGRQQRLPPL